MFQQDRRAFLADVGRGVVAASIGTGLAEDLGFSTAFADQGTERLSFGTLEPLVALMQETVPARLIPMVVERLRQGTSLRDVVAAAAYANARTFGGEDYIGFHTMMAIPAAYQMAAELPEAKRAMPVLKVLFRNANRIQAQGGTRNEVLKPVTAAPVPAGRPGPEALRDACRARDVNRAEGLFATIASSNADDAFNAALMSLADGAEVHRVVLPYRAWDLMGIIGRDHAHTLLRQSIRYNIKLETPNYVQHISSIRTLVPRLLDQHRLPGREPDARAADDAWIERMAETIFRATPEQAAEAAAAALAEGMQSDAIGEAFCLAANQLVLRDNGRTQNQVSPGKPVGSVHGDSTGVHACDSANAWRNLARAANPRNKAVCLILGAWQARARSPQSGLPHAAAVPARGRPGPRPGHWPRCPAAGPGQRHQGQRPGSRRGGCPALLADGSTGAGGVGFAVGLRHQRRRRLRHAEKYYRTAASEYAASRPAFRNRQVVALARVTASAHGFAAPGHTDACRLLGL